MLLEDLTAEERASVEKIGAIKKYAKGDYVVKENEEGGSLFVILSGKLRVEKGIDAERKKCLKELGAGEFFGEMSFFGAEPRSAAVIAADNCELMELPKAPFEGLVSSNPVIGAKIYRNMARTLTDRLRDNNDEIKRTILWAIEGWTYTG